MIAAPVQKFLAIKVKCLRPTVTLSGARNLTGLDENHIKELIESGDLIAWNIARATDLRREVRILSAAADAWPAECRWTEDKIILALYGPDRPFIQGTRFFRGWNCDSGHMCNLVADKTLALLPRTSYGQGRGCTPCITWQSAIAFLKDRRIA